jgi:hypothetical protein
MEELTSKKVAPSFLFQNHSEEFVFDGKKIEVISQNSFIDALSLLETEFNENEMECMLNSLSQP